MEKAYIWGAAKYGQLALEYCKNEFEIEGFIDKRAGDDFNELCGKNVISPNSLDNINISTIVIAVTYPVDILNFINENHLHIKNIYIFDGRNSDSLLLYKLEDNEICIPQYMDKRYAECKEYEEHYSNLSPYTLSMFEKAVDWLKTKIGGEYGICEIACGSGQFANMLFDNGFTNYIGIDFSNKAIELAKKTNPQYENNFICADAFSFLKSYQYDVKTIFAAFEMLEHIDKDRELLEMLPTGSEIIFSVPNFKSFNHLRTFKDLNDIKGRYDMLEILDYEQLFEDESGKNIFHLVCSKRK